MVQIPQDSFHHPQFTNDKLNSFGWVGQNSYISLQNGYSGFGYPDYSFLSPQVLGIQYIANLQKTINFTYIGTYTLSFYDCWHPEYQMNQMPILFNGVLLNTLTDTQNSWIQYTNSLNVNVIGNYAISFNLQDSIHDNDIALALISLTLNHQAPIYYASPPSVGTITIIVPKTLNCNKWKSTNIYGFLNLNDYTISGVTISD